MTCLTGFAAKVMEFVSAKLCLSAASALNVAAIMVDAESTETQSSRLEIRTLRVRHDPVARPLLK